MAERDPSRRRRTFPSENVLAAGAMLALAGVVLAYWFVGSKAKFEALPNHLRIAALIPLTWGVALMHVPALVAREEADAPQTARAVGALLAAVMLPLASLAWWLFA